MEFFHLKQQVEGSSSLADRDFGFNRLLHSCFKDDRIETTCPWMFSLRMVLQFYQESSTWAPLSACKNLLPVISFSLFVWCVCCKYPLLFSGAVCLFAVPFSSLVHLKTFFRGGGILSSNVTPFIAPIKRTQDAKRQLRILLRRASG